MNRTPIRVAAAVAAAIAVAVPAYAAGTGRPAIGHPTATRALPPCPTEDSSGCFWDAGRRGNGRGYSFWTDRHGAVHYLDPHAAAAIRAGR